MKPIKGFEDYYVTEDGKIYSTKISPRYNPEGNVRLVRPRLHPSGYLYYGLFVGEGAGDARFAGGEDEADAIKIANGAT